jgi:hypothetical protein
MLTLSEQCPSGALRNNNGEQYDTTGKAAAKILISDDMSDTIVKRRRLQSSFTRQLNMDLGSPFPQQPRWP